MIGVDKPLKRYWLLAGLFGALSPGLGHAYLGRWRAAIGFAGSAIGVAVLIGLTLGAWPFGVATMQIASFVVAGFSAAAAIFSWRGRRSLVWSEKPGILRMAGFYAATLAAGISLGLLLREFGPYRPFHIPSRSMEPTVRAGEIVAVRRLDSEAKSQLKGGTIVVFKVGEEKQRPAKLYLMRIVAVGHATVVLENGVPFIDGDPLLQTEKGIEQIAGDFLFTEAMRLTERLSGGVEYSIFDTERSNGPLDNVGPYLVPRGHVFLLGDNRDFSQDSRTSAIGYVPVDAVFGEALYIGWSSDLSRIGKKLN